MCGNVEVIKSELMDSWHRCAGKRNTRFVHGDLGSRRCPGNSKGDARVNHIRPYVYGAARDVHGRRMRLSVSRLTETMIAPSRGCAGKRAAARGKAAAHG
jgi:hypothetical protein